MHEHALLLYVFAVLTTETQALLERMHELPIASQRELVKLLDQMGVVRERRTTKNSFIAFVKKVWPGFIEGYHHKIMAEAFDIALAAQGRTPRPVQYGVARP